MGDFHGTGNEIWAGFGLELGPLAETEKKVWADYEQFLRISNCSKLLDLRHLQEQVKKAFCYKKLL